MYVNYKKQGCLTNKFVECPYYKQAIEEEKKKEEERIIAPDAHEVLEGEKDILEKTVNESVKEALKKYADPKRGIYPDTCYDCLYFSPTTGLCLYMRIKVKDPNNPPCKSKK
ncbi:hypothetical protein IPA_03915 [Ignicoccus pacificus DSM 13166]|uniref:Uncharacterized protein n=1 Tax=Ignicoccus pacificus DSM 13166 TaxID=940294 RepID=A0A977PLC7_9CREN|nr:hypothetical protein IPA_03915 [Ignicoccus pacificus DSM 13166]